MYIPQINPFLYPYAQVDVVEPNNIQYPLGAFFNDASPDKFIMTRLKSGRYSLKPNLKDRMFLFRGESEFHSPCFPNLYRDTTQSYFIEEMMRGQEMFLLILSHPLVQLLDTGIELKGQTVRFEMNLWGVSQHYYNKTSLLDLTSDPEVAMFFATCKYDAVNDKYTPITDENHKPGVIYFYTLDSKEDFKHLPNGKNSPLSTIGLQVFPRSGKQKGFLYYLEKGENFNNVSRLRAFRFKHDANMSEEIYDKFHGGDSLFQTDILTSHWKKYNQDAKVISNRTILLNHLFNKDKSIDLLTREIKTFGYEVRNYIPHFDPDELDSYFAEAKTRYWPGFCQQIHIPGDDGTMKQELLNIPNNPRYSWAFESGQAHVISPNDGYLMKIYQDCLK